MKATIRLFKGLPIETKRKKNPSKELLEKTLKRGFIFSPEVVSNYNNYDELIELVEQEIGLTPEKLNSTFHKSWKKIKEADMTQLVMEQLIHYFTTYGFEELGIFNHDSAYIPNEKLELPDVDFGDIKVVVIKGYTQDELKEKLMNLLSGVALKEDTIKDIKEVSKLFTWTDEDVSKIRNKEVKITFYEDLKITPKNPTEFLRYVVYKATENTLLIKNEETIEAIKENASESVKLFKDYNKKYGLEGLSQVFYRFKPLFLAFKNVESASIINKIRRLAREHHKPLAEDYLNSVTSKLKKGENVSRIVLELELAKVNTFRKIRLAYALKFRTTDCESILYRLRNGKSYVTEFSFKYKSAAKRVFEIVVDSITKDINKNVKGKKIYLPEGITYTLPATEKQFTGNLPSGTYVSVPKDMVFGVHWNNVGSHRIDLDLSLINCTGKYGWDGSYRSEGRDILFSGDITDAPNGATELFYVKRQTMNSSILMVNYYNYNENVPVPFKIITAKEEPKDFKGNYMVNPNNVIAIANSEISQRQKILGLLVSTTNECRFYFAESSMGNVRSSSDSDQTKHSREYLFNFYKNTINLNDILKKTEVEIVDDVKDCDIDLSYETLEKDTILNLIK